MCDVNGRSIVLFGAGNECKKIINFIGKDTIRCIYDNDPLKDGSLLEGIQIKRFDGKIDEDVDVYITPRGNAAVQIELQLKNYNIAFHKAHELVKTKWNINNNILKYKNKYKGKRCFLLGTGPSLTIDDLELLKEKHEICFGANRMFKMFKDTIWRPDFYVAIDYKVIKTYLNELSEISKEIDCFVSDIGDTNYLSTDEMECFNKTFKNKVHLYCQDNIFEDDSIDFSFNVDRYIAEGMTVIYAMIQLAAYMGFSEMYLMGVDFNYKDITGLDGSAEDHCCKNYINPNEIVNPPRPEINLKAFKTSERISRENGFRIFNATRGGKLEVFERVDFELLLGGE